MKRKRKQRATVNVYIQFVLCKNGCEHNAAMQLLSHHLKIPVNSITFAGTKDKIGITYQLCVVPNVSPQLLLSVNDAFQKIQVGNLKYVDGPMVRTSLV